MASGGNGAGGATGSAEATSSSGSGGAGGDLLDDCVGLPPGSASAPSNPTVIATEPPGWFMGDIAVDETYVYWTTSPPDFSTGRITAAYKGGDTPFTIVSGQQNPLYMVLDDDYIYWGNHGSFKGEVMRVRKDGSDLSTLAVGPAPFSLAIDKEAVYWSSLDDATIKRVPKQGGTVSILAQGSGAPQGLALDATHVYWAEYGKDRIARVPKMGGDVEIVATTSKAPRGVAVDCDAVYWSNHLGQAGLYRLPFGASNPTFLSPNVLNSRLVLDSQNVYGDWLPIRVPKAGGKEQWLTNELLGGRGVALDAKFYYTATQENEPRIIRIPR